MWSGAALAAFVSVIGVAVAVAYRLDAGIPEKERALARAAGAPLTIEEIDAFYPTSPEIAETTRLWQMAFEKLGAEEDQNEEFARRTEGVPLLGADRKDGDSNPPDRDASGLLQGEDLRIAREFVQENRDAIEAAHDARRSGSVARFPTKWEDHYAMLLPHVYPLRKFVDVLRLDLEVHVADGETQAAVDDLLTIVGVSESLSNEPILVSQLVRIACLNVAVEGTEKLLAHGGLTDEQLRQIGEAFARQDFQEAFRTSLAGERWMFVRTFEVGASGLSDSGAYIPLWFRGADLAKGLELFRRADEAAQQGLLEAYKAGDAIETELDALTNGPTAGLRYVFTLLMFPAIKAAVSAHLRAEAAATLAETAVACERYRLAHGDLPAKLEDLVPEYLASVPLDPFDEQPLRYVVDAQGPRLYSIGSDFKDDGGGAANPMARTFAPADDVFQLPPSAPPAP